MVRVGCPHCQQPLQVPEAHLARLIRCPGCKQTFSVRLPPPPVARLEVAAATSAGSVRPRNEDAYLTQHLSWAGARGRHELALLLVADGLGGHAAGDRASAAATAAFAAALAPRLAELVAGTAPDEEGLIELVDHGLWQASRAIVRLNEEEPELADAGATAVAALVVDGRAAVCHVGDCRAYRWRGGELKALTRDHTVAWRMVELGQLSEEEAARQSSPVARALGRMYDFEPSRQTLRLAASDWLLLACDGLHGQVGEAAIAASVAAAAGAGEAVAGLVRRADEAGGRDNCTVAAVRAVGA